MSDRPRRWDDCTGDPCICPKPLSPEQQRRIVLDMHVAVGGATEMSKWLNWLADIGYGQDFTCDVPPPCTPHQLAEVLNEREPLDDDANEGETGAHVWEWVIAENTGWKAS